MRRESRLDHRQAPPGRIDHAVGDETAHHRRRALRQAGEDAGIERHQGDRAAIAGEAANDRRDESAVAPAGAFELDHQRHPAGHLLQKLRQGQDAVRAAGERDAGQGGGRAGGDGTGLAGQPLEPLVMEDDRTAVGGELDVAFDRVMMSHCRGKCRSAVLDPAGIAVVQAAMGDRSGGEKAEVGARAGSRQRP